MGNQLRYNAPFRYLAIRRSSMTKKLVTLTIIIGLVAVQTALAQDPPQRGRGGRGGQDQAQQQAQQQAPAGAATAPRLPPPEEKGVVTKHQGKFGGNAVNYTA